MAVKNFRSSFPETLPVNWPAAEPIPQTMEEALDLGWQVSGTDAQSISDDEQRQKGNVELVKRIGMIELSLSVPYRATLTYGKPRDPEARANVAEMRGDETPS